MNRHRKYSAEALAPAVTSSRSMANLLTTLGLRQAGGNYVHLKALIASFGLSTSHWVGQGWAKGKTRQSDPSIAKVTKAISLSDEEVFTLNGTPVSGDKLMKRLLARGREYKCGECGNPGEWRGRPLRLEIHHLNGIHSDNREENLQIICPNCHKQTMNWGRVTPQQGVQPELTSSANASPPPDSFLNIHQHPSAV